MKRRSKSRVLPVILAVVAGWVLVANFSMSVSSNLLRRRLEIDSAQTQVSGSVQQEDQSLTATRTSENPPQAQSSVDLSSEVMKIQKKSQLNDESSSKEAATKIKEMETKFLRQHEVLHQETNAYEIKEMETKFQREDEVLSQDMKKEEQMVSKVEQQNEPVKPQDATLSTTERNKTLSKTEQDETPEEVVAYEMEKRMFQKANSAVAEATSKKEKEQKQSKLPESATSPNEKSTTSSHPVISVKKDPDTPTSDETKQLDKNLEWSMKQEKLLNIFDDENETNLRKEASKIQESYEEKTTEQETSVVEDRQAPNLFDDESETIETILKRTPPGTGQKYDEKSAEKETPTKKQEEAPKLSLFGDGSEISAQKTTREIVSSVKEISGVHERQSPKQLDEESRTDSTETLSTPQNETVTGEPKDIETLILKDLRKEMCADEWNVQPVDYQKCDPEELINVIPLFGGMCNALKFVILGAVQSAEENRCFVVDESHSPLNYQNKEGEREGFINKFFEPIGLDMEDEKVKLAKATNRTVIREWDQFWVDLGRRRVFGRKYTIPNLGYSDIDGHQLKRNMMRRMWRPIPKVRKATCDSIEQYNLDDEYMAFSVRRGDKTEEKFAYTKLHEYIDSAEANLYRYPSYMKNLIVPDIFVATDDCTVMSEFRELRPLWTFVSECDKEKKLDHGFALADVHNWGRDEQAAHFGKFFVEIFALTGAKVFIGVAYTNVSWWVYFLRPFRHSFVLLDKPKGHEDNIVFDNW